MTKTSAPLQTVLPTTHSQGFIRGLIEAMQHLVVVVSSRLRCARIHRSPMGDEKGGHDMWVEMMSYLQKIPAKELSKVPHRSVRKVVVKPPKQRDYIAVPESAPNEFREYNRRKTILRQHPHVKETLQNNTTEHINTALIMASEGDPVGASLHIELAQSAMKTASRFMSYDEFEAFEKRVAQRIKSLIEGVH